MTRLRPCSPSRSPPSRSNSGPRRGSSLPRISLASSGGPRPRWAASASCAHCSPATSWFSMSSATSPSSRPSGRRCTRSWHSNQHTTELNDAHIQSILITTSAHPLRGQVVPVVRQLTQNGVLFLVIRLPTGSTQLIPAHWTNLDSPKASPSAGLTFTAASLRSLIRMVVSLRTRAHPEAADDADASVQTVGELQPADPAPLRLPVDGSPPPSSPGPTGPSEGRPR
jgi:hypothetical protein